MLDYFSRLRQTSVISLVGWHQDDEFPIAPKGAKPKRIFVSPNPTPHAFVVGGHRYLFKEPDGPHVYQIWSEVIAYHVARTLEVPVPPAFLATAPGNGSPGVLVEFFFGYSWLPETRLIHGIDILQGANIAVNERKGSLRDNRLVCRMYGVQDWRRWWAKTVIFDALIGNTDRHSENWGLLRASENNAPWRMAPAFDNGASLGPIVREQDLPRFIEADRLQAFISKGTHHYSWLEMESKAGPHIDLAIKCVDSVDRQFILQMLSRLSDSEVARVVRWCQSLDFGIPFSSNRAKFVYDQLTLRRDQLIAGLCD